MILDTITESPNSMQSLALPDLDLKTVTRDGKRFVLDPVRRKYVRLTPEEWVRQRVLAYLIDVVGVPKGLIGVETAIVFNGMARRVDVLVYDRRGDPLILVECKAPDIALDQSVFDQVGRYNVVVGARYILVSNGLSHYCYVGGSGAEEVTFMADLPRFEQLAIETEE